LFVIVAFCKSWFVSSAGLAYFEYGTVEELRSFIKEKDRVKSYKNNTRQLEIQRLPGINGAKIGNPWMGEEQ
jgi:hypothetical protein